MLFQLKIQNKPIMNDGWLSLTTPDEEYPRLVKHEFGRLVAHMSIRHIVSLTDEGINALRFLHE